MLKIANDNINMAPKAISFPKEFTTLKEENGVEDFTYVPPRSPKKLPVAVKVTASHEKSNCSSPT
jgi:hypothetical protein